MKQLITCLILLVSGFIVPAGAQTGSLPLVFVPNEGQWDGPFLYKGQCQNADLYLEKGGITYLVAHNENAARVHAFKEGETMVPPVLSFHAYRMKWLGGNQVFKTRSSKKQSYYHNYYLDKDPARWKGGVGVYGNVDFENVYPDIDLHFGSEKGHLKYDFIVKPGADPDAIRLAFEGADKLELSAGNLLIHTSVGVVTEMAPYAFQYIDGELKEVPCKYKLRGNELSFHFPRGYDRDVMLTIDPTTVFATLTGSVADNWGFTATYDNEGNLYAGGIVSSNGYPTTIGAFQLTFSGGTAGTQMPSDISISKFNPQGTALIYSTYIGGTENDMPHSLVVDHDNNLIVAGKSLSSNYPVTANAFDQQHNNNYDIIVTKFNPSGTGIIGSTFVGGSGDDGINRSASFTGNRNFLNYNYGDGSRSEVIVDDAGNIYVAASSRSTNFPVTTNAAKSTIGGDQDGVFFKLNPSLTTMLYCTYIGGSADDAAYVLTLDTAQAHIYVSGGTASSDFHTNVTAGSWRSSYQGGIADGYICRFQNGGAYTLQKATFIGTSAYDQCYGIQIDLENNVYAMGQTMGAFPVSPGVYSNPGSRHFLIKLDNMLSTAAYSTVFGNGASNVPNLSLVAFLVDTCQNVYISGWGGTANSPTTTVGLPVSPDAFRSNTDGNDFYFIVLSKNALSLLFASFFGVDGKGEHVDGGTSRFDPQGVVYQAMCASCGGGTGFPSTPGAYSQINGSPNCNLGAVKIAFNLGSVNAVASASPNVSGCAPLFVQFGNASTNATSYNWNFGDGTAPSTLDTPGHTFTNPGVYNVRMVAINPNACKTHDTVFLQIVVSDDTLRADFDYALLDTCTNPRVMITNTSLPMPGRSLTDATFQWFFGDNTSSSGINPGSHSYGGPGVYELMMVMTDTMACNSPDTVVKLVEINQIFVDAGFSIPDTICVGDTTLFTNTSTNATSFQWTFGNGQGGSTDEHARHTFTEPGTFVVTLRSFNPTSCNKADSITRTITVNPNPTASFSFTPLLPETNVPTTFHNQSQNATRYQWSFGDGQGSTEEHPVHNYNRSGTYTVCLTAFNSLGCKARVCKPVTADILPLADVPTAFTPNGDGANDVLYVRGYSIQTLDFKIFNRWGEMVFETQNQSKGWDGTYKGKPQEMEAYGYTLFVVFYDGTTLKKQGNITLLR
jgi:gliding motility-associated-like protein